MYHLPVCQDDIKPDDLIQSESPGPTGKAVPAMQKVTPYANAGTGTMGHSPLALLIERRGHVSQADAAGDSGNLRLGVYTDTLEVSKVHDELAVFAAIAEGGVRSARPTSTAPLCRDPWHNTEHS